MFSFSVYMLSCAGAYNLCLFVVRLLNSRGSKTKSGVLVRVCLWGGVCSCVCLCVCLVCACSARVEGVVVVHVEARPQSPAPQTFGLHIHASKRRALRFSSPCQSSQSVG